MAETRFAGALTDRSFWRRADRLRAQPHRDHQRAVAHDDSFADNRIIYNSSVWKLVEALFHYTYASDHADFFRRRAQWFEPPTCSPVALWWVEEGHRPDIIEGRARLKYLWRHGPSAKAFDLKTPFGPDGVPFPSDWRRRLTGTKLAACE